MEVLALDMIGFFFSLQTPMDLQAYTPQESHGWGFPPQRQHNPTS